MAGFEVTTEVHKIAVFAAPMQSEEGQYPAEPKPKLHNDLTIRQRI